MAESGSESDSIYGHSLDNERGSIMNLRITGLLMLVISAVFLLSPTPGWVNNVSAMTFIAGFLVFALDFMWRQIAKSD